MGLDGTLIDKQEVIVKPSAFATHATLFVDEGLSIRDILDKARQANPLAFDNYLVQLNGEVLSESQYDIILQKEHHLLITVPMHGGGGGGGKDPMRTVLMLAVMVAAVAVTGFVGGGLSSTMIGGITFGTIAGGLTTAGLIATGLAGSLVMAAGMFLVDMIAPIKTGEIQTFGASPSYGITGSQNQANPYGAVPVVLGKRKMHPLYASAPYTEGGDEYLHMLFVWGYGRVKVEDIKIGDTPLSSYTDYEIETHESIIGSEFKSDLFPTIVYQEAVNMEMKLSETPPVVRVLKEGSSSFAVDIVLPQGLRFINDDGNWETIGVYLIVDIREAGTEEWTEGVIDELYLGQTDQTLKYTERRDIDPNKRWEIKIVAGNTPHSRSINTTILTNIRSFINDNPIQFDQPLTITALRIKASDQLSGIINSLNGIVTSYAPIWDGEKWTEEEYPTQNPAALYRLVLKHPANPRPRSDSQIDNQNLAEWYEFCEAHGFKFNMVRDAQSSVWNTLSDIASAGRASISLRNGTWGVTWDSLEKPLVQHITPRNSWGFESSKALYIRPHAFRVRFYNEENGYKEDERIVYADGYDKTNAEIYETVEFIGITSPDLAYRFARFHMAQLDLRPETYVLNMDFEHLVCQRGDLVRVSHDVPLWGIGAARIKSVVLDADDPSRMIGIELDDIVATDSTAQLVARFRLETGESVVYNIQPIIEPTTFIYFSEPIEGIDSPQDGDLVMIGEAGTETAELVVKSIERNDNFTAKLTLVDYSPSIYTADTELIPPFQSNITRPTDIEKTPPLIPDIMDIFSGTNALEVFKGAIRSRIGVVPTIKDGIIPVESVRMRYRLSGIETWSYILVDKNVSPIWINNVNDHESYEIQIQAISIYGVSSRFSESYFHTVVGQSELPPDVEGFSCNTIGGTTYLNWDTVLAIDLSHYVIRFTSDIGSPIWASGVVLIPSVSKGLCSVAVPAMLGVYMIKAVDYQGNESANAAILRTDINYISGLNYVESIQAPQWDGTFENIELNSALNALVLSDSVSSGSFTFSEQVDLQDVFTVRLNASLVVASLNNQNDLYVYEDLYALKNLYGGDDSQYNVAFQCRHTIDDPISSSAVWSDWGQFSVGDYSARAFQFRVLLESYAENITPVVYSIKIDIDMEDRVEGFNAVVPQEGLHIDFTPAFFVVPEVGISVENGASGDRYEITNKTPAGFYIQFFNDNIPVSRTISGVAKAYGRKEV
jgi:hypothetical protein